MSATPGTSRTELAFCQNCSNLCAHVPHRGWRHLLLISDNPSAPAPYVGFQTDGDSCDAAKAARRELERPR